MSWVFNHHHVKKKTASLFLCQKRSKRTIDQRKDWNNASKKFHNFCGCRISEVFGSTKNPENLGEKSEKNVTILWFFLVNLGLFTSILYAIDHQRHPSKNFHYNLKPPKCLSFTCGCWGANTHGIFRGSFP